MGTQAADHTQGGVVYKCTSCGWVGSVHGRPRCLPCYAKRTAEWRKNNPEAAKDLKRRMYRKLRNDRPQKEAERKRIRRSRNPELCRDKYAQRLNWLRSGDVTADQLRSVFQISDGKCHYCGVDVRPRFTPSDPRGFDHVIPRAKGGLHTHSNLVVCCASCNARKSDNE